MSLKITRQTRVFLLLMALGISLGQPFQPRDVWAADTETYTYKLTQSTLAYQFWTTPPSERVFKDAAVPTATGAEVKVYAARNEFEPFQVVVKPVSSGNVTVSIDPFG